MDKLDSPRGFVEIEINRLMEELQVIIDHMDIECQPTITHDAYHAYLLSRQIELIKKIEIQSQELCNEK